MLVILAHVERCSDFRAVIACEYYKCVFFQAKIPEGNHQLTDYVVHLVKEIPVGTGFGLAPEFWSSKGWQVDGLHRVE